jgi:hypothetical protein
MMMKVNKEAMMHVRERVVEEHSSATSIDRISYWSSVQGSVRIRVKVKSTELVNSHYIYKAM